ncbi:MAG: DUF58 domain-containing protein, partial [Candidatus Rokuibacteriota bacterium]
MAPEWPPAFLRPKRTIQPTREGWWCLAVALLLGLTAVNSGNNLLYLLESVVLALIVVSGVMSEQSLRGVRLTPLVPDEVFAGQAVMLGAVVRNAKRRLPARSIALETADGARVIALPWLGPGAELVAAWSHAFPRRGRQQLPGLRLTTRFPFGLFAKRGRVQFEQEVVVFPAPAATAARRLRIAPAGGGDTARRRGRGQGLHDLREYRPGDDPRLIHWRVSARTGTTVVRELEAEATADVRILLRGTGARDPRRLERGLSEAAGLVLHGLAGGAAVSLAGAGLAVPPGRG